MVRVCATARSTRKAATLDHDVAAFYRTRRRGHFAPRPPDRGGLECKPHRIGERSPRRTPRRAYPLRDRRVARTEDRHFVTDPECLRRAIEPFLCWGCCGIESGGHGRTQDQNAKRRAGARWKYGRRRLLPGRGGEYVFGVSPADRRSRARGTRRRCTATVAR